MAWLSAQEAGGRTENTFILQNLDQQTKEAISAMQEKV